MNKTITFEKYKSDMIECYISGMESGTPFLANFTPRELEAWEKKSKKLANEYFELLSEKNPCFEEEKRKSVLKTGRAKK